MINGKKCNRNGDNKETTLRHLHYSMCLCIYCWSFVNIVSDKWAHLLPNKRFLVWSGLVLLYLLLNYFQRKNPRTIERLLTQVPLKSFKLSSQLEVLLTLLILKCYQSTTSMAIQSVIENCSCICHCC